MARTANKFLVKKYEAEGLNKLADEINRLMNDACRSYEVVGKETEQARDWRTNELLWEDDEQTVPKFRDKYDYVDIPVADMDDERFAQYTAYQNLLVQLEKLL